MPVDASVKATVSGASPSVTFAVKLATGSGVPYTVKPLAPLPSRSRAFVHEVRQSFTSLAFCP